MKKKIEKYLQSKNGDSNAPIVDQSGRFLIGSDIEGCLRATQQPGPGSKSVKNKGRSYEMPHFGTPAPIMSRPVNGMVPMATPMSVHPNSGMIMMKRPYDSMMTDGFPALGYTPHSVKRAKTSPVVDQVALDAFLDDLKGGYVKGLYQSSLERRKNVEKAVKGGNQESLKSLGLSSDEEQRLRKIIDQGKQREHWTPRHPYGHHHFGYMHPYMPPHHGHWSHPSPHYPTSGVPLNYPPSTGKAPKVQAGNSTLKHSPLMRAKDSAKQKGMYSKYKCWKRLAFFSRIPHILPRFFLFKRAAEAEAKEKALSIPPTGDEKDAIDALMATPGRKPKSGTCFSPFMGYTPQAALSGTPGLGPNWGLDDATLLHDPFQKQTFGGANPPFTPKLSGTGNITEAPPSTTTKFIASNLNTPRVFFKDQLTETLDFAKASTPFATGLSATPARSKAVTGSGPDRIRGNPMDEERNNLLSTAFLDTPKSTKAGKMQDIDQSLHHIDACIKSPLNFGSPTMKGSPLRN